MALHVRAIRHRVDEQIFRYINSSQSRKGVRQKTAKYNVKPYITVSRETGAGGSEVARKVALQLGWDLLDKEIVDYLTEHYGTPRSLVESVDETHRTWFQEIVTSWITGLSFPETTYTHRLGRLFLTAARHRNIVIVGRGARFFLPRERGFSVRIIAPLEFRVEQTMLQRGISEQEARDFVAKSDRGREAYIREHFHNNATDPHQYDCVVNVETLNQSEAVQLITDAARTWLNRELAVA